MPAPRVQPKARPKAPVAPKKKNIKPTRQPRTGKGKVAKPEAPPKVAGKAAADPRFKKVMAKIDQGAAKVKSHAPPEQKASEAQAAAQSPANEQLAGAQANQVDQMKDTKTGKPEPNNFLTLLRAEIEKIMPQNLDESDKFMDGGEKDQMKSAVSGNVGEQRDAAAGPLKATAQQPPDPSTVPARQAEPMPGEPPVPPPAVNTAEAMPAPKPATEVSKPGEDAKKAADKQMKDAELTPEQLQKANDPRFSAVVAKKNTVVMTAATGPAKYQASERKVLGAAAAGATAAGKVGLAAFAAVRKGTNAAVLTRQQAAKLKDEARRKEVVANIEKLFGKTKAAVEAKLNSLDTEVTSLFDRGADAAINNMKTYSRKEIEKYKDERYSGIRGAARWLADRFRPVPPGIKAILQKARTVFMQEMDVLIVRIAKLVDTRLAEAKAEIDRGQAAIKTYVNKLPADLREVGKQAQSEVAGRFDELRQGVDAKKQQLASKLAERYKKASEDADAALKKIEEENKSALGGLIEAIGEVLKVLTEFKNKLMSLLRKAQSAIKLIIADPIGFLKNLLAAIKGGFMRFIDNIWTHLKTAFMKWLFGALADAGIELPKDLTLPSLLKLVLAVLGITYERMRAKAVKLIGERNVAMIEKLVEYVKALITGGPAALWEKVKEDLGNLKDMVIGAIQEWLITTLIKKAITKLVTMFNPAGAIIQAIMTIYDVIIFIVEKAKQIMVFVEAVVNSVHAIATGAIGGAISWIEKSLANILPLLIGFLAQWIGLGGISAKIKEFILKVQTKVDKAIDKVIGKIVDTVKKLFGRGAAATGANASDDSRSRNVKEQVKTALRGKTINNPKEAETLISGVFSRLQPKGLKGIKLVADPKNKGQIGVKVSASVSEIIANMPMKKYEDLIKIYSFVSKFRAEAGKTRLYVFYDVDSKLYSDSIDDDPAIVSGVEGHAETIFIRQHISRLKAKIAADRAANKIKTPPGQPVKVELNLNRLPCGGCSERLANLSSANPDLQFVLKASSVWKIGGLHPATSAEDVKKMLDAGIKVEALDVWEAFAKRLREYGAAVAAKKIRITSGRRADTLISIMNLEGPQLKLAAAEVERLVAEAAKLSAQSGKAEEEVAKVPAKGTV